MIYFHICEHEGLRALNQGILDQMNNLFPSISLATLSNHNNNRDYRVFLPIMNQLISLCLKTLTSEEIAWLYKRRWDIELFFKWIKQHCKIKNLLLVTILKDDDYHQILFNSC